MSFSSSHDLRFRLGAEVCAAVNLVIQIFISSEDALLQTVFITSVGIGVDILKARWPVTLAKMENAYEADFCKIGRVLHQGEGHAFLDRSCRCPCWIGRTAGLITRFIVSMNF